MNIEIALCYESSYDHNLFENNHVYCLEQLSQSQNISIDGAMATSWAVGKDFYRMEIVHVLCL